MGILLTTVVYDVIYQALADGLNAQLVLSSPSAGRYSEWVSSTDPNAPVIYTTFVVYNVTNPDAVVRGAPLVGWVPSAATTR